MTFAEVPVGHVFKLGSWDCPCLLRKAGATEYQWAQVCPKHDPSRATSNRGKSYQWIDSGMGVKYDPFLAALETQKP